MQRCVGLQRAWEKLVPGLLVVAFAVQCCLEKLWTYKRVG
jgi:hypothetical protein